MQKFRNKKTTKRAHATTPFRSFPVVARNILAIAVCAGLGYWSLMNAGATTFQVGNEAEQGILSGRSTINNDAAASNQAAVGFGTFITAPAHVQVYTGGDSIAIVWAMPDTGQVQSIQVFRNGSQIGTVTPGTGTLHVELQGTRYIDKAVTNGTQYSYQLRAVGLNGTMSPLTPAITVTQQLKTAIPNVVVDSSLSSKYDDYLKNYIVPEIKTWYPKLADSIAVGGYTPYSGTITIQPDPNCNCVAYVGGGLPVGYIKVDEGHLAIPSNAEEGMLMHEVTHILQSYDGSSSPTNWVTESLADWTREWFMYERYKVYLPGTRTSLATGYSEGSYMLQWTATKYNLPNLARDVNIAVRTGAYNDNFLPSRTGGKTAEQLYAEMKSNYFGSEGSIKTGSMCIRAGADTFITTCGSDPNQVYKKRYTQIDIEAPVMNKTYFNLMAPILTGESRDYCLDIPSNGTATGTIVRSWSCNGSKGQEWIAGSNGSLINPNSGKCLATQGGIFADTTKLIITECDNSASQKWTIPQ